MATINKSLEYPFNLLDAINRSSNAPGYKFSFTKEQMLEIIDDAVRYRITSRESKVIDLRYKEYHTCKEAGTMLDDPISGGRFSQIEARMLRKLRVCAMRYRNALEREEEKKIKMTLDKIKEMTEPVWLHWRERMPLMAAEEAGEFIQAVSKLERKLWARDIEGNDLVRTEAEYDHVIEEMGDVLIVIGALANRYSITADEIEKAIRDKLSEERTM